MNIVSRRCLNGKFVPHRLPSPCVIHFQIRAIDTAFLRSANGIINACQR
jgi:hypothetical protein